MKIKILSVRQLDNCYMTARIGFDHKITSVRNIWAKCYSNPLNVIDIFTKAENDVVEQNVLLPIPELGVPATIEMRISG